MIALDKMIKNNIKAYDSGNSFMLMDEEDDNPYYNKAYTFRFKEKKPSYYIVNDTELYDNLQTIQRNYNCTMTELRNRLRSKNCRNEPDGRYYDLGKLTMHYIKPNVKTKTYIKVSCGDNTFEMTEACLKDMKLHKCKSPKIELPKKPKKKKRKHIIFK